MREQISKPLKLAFLLHFFVAIIFGLIFLLFIEVYVDVTGWPYLDPIAGRTLGAAFIGFGMASLLCWRETEWSKVKIIVQMEITWLIIGTVAQFWAVFTMFPSIIPPFIVWVNIVIMLVFCIAFSWFYYRQEMGK
jgi:hypothetical protein